MCYALLPSRILIPFPPTLWCRLLPPGLYLGPRHQHISRKCLFQLLTDQEDPLLFPPHLTQTPPLLLDGLWGLILVALPLKLGGSECCRLI